MGRANVYLPDELERRVKQAQLPISEICQRALLAALQAAEAESGYPDEISTQYERGLAAGTNWARTASVAARLGLLRDQRFDEIPVDALPEDQFSLSREQSLAWEAGFSTAARAAVADSQPVGRPAPPEAPPPAEAAGAGGGADQSAATGDPDASGPAGEPGGPPLGDDAGCHIGHTLDGDQVSFDPHAAVRAGKSPLFAVLGEPDLRTRLTLSVAQDAAARGTAVVVLDLSGQLSSRAAGHGRNIRLVATQTSLPQLDDLVRGAVGLGGLMGTLSTLASSSGLLNAFGRPSDELAEPGYISIVDLSGDAALVTALSAAQGLARLLGNADFPRLVLIDLPPTMSVPAALGTRLGRLVRAAREQNAAVGLCAASAESVSAVAGTGALLSTVFAFATSSPAEADRLRDLLGSGAPVLLNPPGATVSASDEAWVVMRDLAGRVGQLRLEV
jgi:hypothetical protein